MTPILVHSVPGSPYGRSVLAVLEEKGLPYRLKPLGPGASKTPEHLARHPFGRIPVIEQDDFQLYETQAILRYLERIAPVPPLTPKDPQAAARMDQAMNICDWYVFQGVGNVIAFQRVVGPKLLGLVPDEAAVAAAMPKAHVVVQVLNDMVGDQPYLIGAAPSLADFMVAPHLDMLSMAPEWSTLIQHRPALVTWLARMEARPAMQATTWAKVAAMAQAA